MTGARDIELRFGSDGVLRVNVDGRCELRSRLAPTSMLRVHEGDGKETHWLITSEGILIKEEPQ